MDSTPWSWNTCLAVIVASIFVLYKSISSLTKSKNKLPPGPKPWPIVGNLLQMGARPNRSVHEMTKKYGPIMYLRLGSRPAIIGSSVEMAELFFKTHGGNFVDRPKFAAGKYTAYNYQSLIWTPYGPHWRAARKLFVTELFSQKRLDSLEYMRVQEVQVYLGELFKSSGQTIVLRKYLFNLNLNLISRIVLGQTFTAATDKAIVSPDEFMKMIGEFFFLNGALNIGDYIPWLDFLDLQGYTRRMKRLSKKFDRFLEHVVEKHEERRLREGKNFVPGDMVDVMLQLADDPSLEVKMTRESVKALTQDLFIGSTDTAVQTVEWAVTELLRNPKMLKKATEELDHAIGRNRWFEEKDIENLPYLEAIVKETMRLHPAGPLIGQLISMEHTKIHGYDIPAGTNMTVNIWTIQRDPKIWESPLEFRPERFIGSPIDFKGHHFELTPFGSGRRMCPGYPLGLKMVYMSLANLLHGFKVELPKGVKAEDLNMEEVWGLSSPREVPIEIVVEPRISLDLFGF
ncbi:hypothetical protein LUZ60_006488 [Juncus effusus]|nr:hypothetical protein LUZ60_006488 [Juncus effusus]